MHSLLVRQLKRCFGSREAPVELRELIEAVGQAYEEFDADRRMLERSLELSSKELLQANSEMRAVLRALPDLFFRLDATGRILDCKGGREEDFFVPPAELIGKRIQDVPTTDVALQFERGLAEIALSKAPLSFEYALELGGDVSYHEARLLPLVEGEILAIVRNVTDRHLAAAELDHQRSFLRQVIDLNPNFIFAKDRDGRFTLVNQAVADAYGTTVDALIGKTDADFNENTDEVDQFRRDDREVIDHGMERHIPEESFTDAQGAVRWLQTIKRPIATPSGKIEHMLGVATDITKRKLAEERLRARTEQVLRNGEALHELASMRSVDLGDAVFKITDTAARTMSTPRVVVWLYNEKGTALGCVHAFDHGEHRRFDDATIDPERYGAYFEALEAGRTIAARRVGADPRTASLAAEHMRPHGVRSSLDVSIRLHGALAGVVSFQQTDRERSWTLEEQNFAASVADLISVAVEADRRRELEQQLRQSQKMEAVGLLAGGIAHDFNNLLNVISGFCELASARLPSSHPSAGYLSKVTTAAEKASELTGKLLTFSRKHVVRMDPVDVNGLLDEFTVLLNRIVGEDIEVVILPAHERLTVKADRAQLDQVLLNLCTNARQAMPKGGRLTIRTGLATVDASRIPTGSAAEPGEYVMLSVEDTGVGIDEELLDRIVEPFFTTKPEGTGLGLAMVYGIVEQHLGIIDVHSEVGRGSTFEVYLPVHECPVAAAGVSSTLSLPVGSETLLVAEDEDMLRELIVTFLRELGYEVLVAVDGEHAVEVFAENRSRIDLVVLDVVMPKLSGPDTLARLRRLSPGVRAVFASGYVPESTSFSEALAADDVELVLKPFRMEELAWKVRSMLDVPVLA